MNPDEQAIRDVVAQWHAATAAGDVETVLSLMSKDVVFLVPGKPPMRGRSEFEKQLREVTKTHRIDSTGEVQEIEISDGLAYCWTKLQVTVTPVDGGKTNERSGNTLSIFRKQQGSWLLTRDANLLAAR